HRPVPLPLRRQARRQGHRQGSVRRGAYVYRVPRALAARRGYETADGLERYASQDAPRPDRLELRDAVQGHTPDRQRDAGGGRAAVLPDRRGRDDDEAEGRDRRPDGGPDLLGAVLGGRPGDVHRPQREPPYAGRLGLQDRRRRPP